MLSYERRSRICAQLEQQGSVTIAALAREYGVTTETVRKDLLLLEKNGSLQRVHGGAVLPSRRATGEKLSVRMDMACAHKQELSRYAARFIEDGDCLALDAGSTAAALCDVLAAQFTRLRIITYSTLVFEKLCDIDGFEVILCGGKRLPDEDALYGPLTAAALQGLHADKAFVFPLAVSLSAAVTTGSYEITELQRLLLQIADRVLVLADSDKFEKNATYRLCDFSRVSALVTDSALDDALYTLYTENGITVIRE